MVEQFIHNDIINVSDFVLLEIWKVMNDENNMNAIITNLGDKMCIILGLKRLIDKQRNRGSDQFKAISVFPEAVECLYDWTKHHQLRDACIEQLARLF